MTPLSWLRHDGSAGRGRARQLAEARGLRLGSVFAGPQKGVNY